MKSPSYFFVLNTFTFSLARMEQLIYKNYEQKLALSGQSKAKKNAKNKDFGIDSEQKQDVVPEALALTESERIMFNSIRAQKVTNLLKTFGFYEPLSPEQQHYLYEYISSYYDNPSRSDLLMFLFNQASPNQKSVCGNDVQSIFEKKILLEKFIYLNQKYRFFEESDFEDFFSIVKICSLSNIHEILIKNLKIKRSIETFEFIDEAMDRAYKVMTLFGETEVKKGSHVKNQENSLKIDVQKTVKNLDTFITAYLKDNPNSLQIICDKSLPECAISKRDLIEWRKLILSFGLYPLKKFKYADRIQMKNDKKVPKNNSELKAAELSLIYRRYIENKYFAELCNAYGVTNTNFERALDLLDQGRSYAKKHSPSLYHNTKMVGIIPKERDHIPNIMIDVRAHLLAGGKANKDNKGKNLYLVKLPPGDLRGLILGEISRNCQHIGGFSEVCAIDATNLEDNGYLVLIESKTRPPVDLNEKTYRDWWRNFEKSGNEIKGHGYVWISRYGNLAIDSWENKPNLHTEDNLMPTLLQAFAQQVIEDYPSIHRVCIGTGGSTPSIFKNDEYNQSAFDIINQGYVYGDADVQAEVAVSSTLTEKRVLLKHRIEQLNLDLSPSCLFDAYSVSSVFILDELLLFSDETLQEFFLSPNATKVIQLYDFGGSKKKLSTFYHAILDIKYSDPEKYYLLFDSKSIRVDDNGPMADDFCDLIGALKYYQIDIDYLMEITAEKISLLLSPEAIAAYDQGFKFSDIKHFTAEQLQFLTANETKKALVAGRLTIKDLTGLGIDEMRARVCEVLINYKAHRLQYHSLEGVSEEVAALLTSPEALQAYDAGLRLTADIIAQETASEISLRIQYVNLRLEETGPSFDVLKTCTEDIRKLLLSDEALLAYRHGLQLSTEMLGRANMREISMHIAYKNLGPDKFGFLLEDLLQLQASVTSVLTHPRAVKVYKMGLRIDIRELSGLPCLSRQGVFLLTSAKALSAYQNGYMFTTEMLKIFSLSEIEQQIAIWTGNKPLILSTIHPSRSSTFRHMEDEKACAEQFQIAKIEV